MYLVEYIESVVKKDIPGIGTSEKKRIRTSIEEKLCIDPIGFGKPLQYSFKGCRRLRVGDYRVIYKIEHSRNPVLIVKIGHRKEIYK